jgi:hypothetical protein
MYHDKSLHIDNLFFPPESNCATPRDHITLLFPEKIKLTAPNPREQIASDGTKSVHEINRVFTVP